MITKRKRYIAVYLIVLTGILLGIFLLLLRINPILENRINQKLTTLIRHDPDRYYDIRYDSLDIDIMKGNIVVTNFRMVPRKSSSDSLEHTLNSHKYSVELQLGRFEMLGFEWIEFLRTGKLNVDAFRLSDLIVKYYLNKNILVKRQASLGSDILDQKFISAKTELIDLSNGNLKMFVIREDTSLALSFDSLSLRFSEFYSDSSLIKNPIGYRLKEVDLSLGNLRNDLLDNYSVSCNNITFNSKDNLFSLKDIQVNPQEEQVNSKNWLSLSVRSLDLRGIRYDSLLYSGSLLIRQLLVNEPVFTYVRPVERLQKDTIRVLPAVSFQKIPIPMAIDTIRILNGTFDYLKHGYQEPLIALNATDLNVNGLSFSTDPNRYGKENTFNVSGNTRFLGEAMLRLDFSFPLRDPFHTFQIKGDMDKLDARSLNSIIKNSKKMEVVNGTINELQFEINGNDTLATGMLKMDYQDLKLMALKVNQNDFSDTRRKGFLTSLVNIAARTKNDPEKSSFSEGMIYLERDPNYTFLDYSLESLMTGVLTSMVPESKFFIKPGKARIQ